MSHDTIIIRLEVDEFSLAVLKVQALGLQSPTVLLVLALPGALRPTSPKKRDYEPQSVPSSLRAGGTGWQRTQTKTSNFLNPPGIKLSHSPFRFFRFPLRRIHQSKAHLSFCENSETTLGIACRAGYDECDREGGFDYLSGSEKIEEGRSHSPKSSGFKLSYFGLLLFSFFFFFLKKGETD